MKHLYCIIIIFAAFNYNSLNAATIVSNSPTMPSKATIEAKFSNDNKSVQIRNINNYPKKIKTVILNLANGDQEKFENINNKTVSLMASGYNFNQLIIGVWVANNDNSAITAIDSSGYGDYLKNNHSKTYKNPYQASQTDINCEVCQHDTCEVNNPCKVKICHIPSGNPDNKHTIWIACMALTAHLKHGDNRGECGGVTVIPVELISFNAKTLSKSIVELSWSTASEVNNDYFSIERTTDLNSWEQVCKVHGVGNSHEIHNYSCFDSSAGQAGQNTIYYRPKQVDFNGTYEYFNIIKLRLENTENVSALQGIYPNPATDRINIQYHAAENSLVNIRLISIDGKPVLSSTYAAKQGDQIVDINLPENRLAQGIYILEVESHGQVFRQKVYKQ